MKKLLILFSAVLLSWDLSAQTKSLDTTAVLIIDRMTDVIGDMESCSFKLNTATDVKDSNHGMIKYFADYEVYMSGPEKMMINSRSHKGHRQFMYNGQQFAYYSFDENNYGILSTPNSTIKTIDSLSENYGIEFPAADFFYPAFTDDLLADADFVRYLGMETINGKEYFHILAANSQFNFQFWISNDAYNLPAKFVITYKSQEGSPQYYASFSDWQINPGLPDAMFDFLPPPKAAEVRIMSKNER